MIFSQTLLSLLVNLALILTAVSVVTLIALFVADYKKGKIW